MDVIRTNIDFDGVTNLGKINNNVNYNDQEKIVKSAVDSVENIENYLIDTATEYVETIKPIVENIEENDVELQSYYQALDLYKQTLKNAETYLKSFDSDFLEKYSVYNSTKANKGRYSGSSVYTDLIELYDEYASTKGYKSFEDMKNDYEFTKIKISQMNATINVTNQKISTKESLIFYTVKYISTNGDYENFVAKTAIAEKNVRETHVDAAQMVTITCKPDESVSPYQIYVACSAYKTTIEATTLSVREDASERWEKLSALYDASQIDPDLAKIYDYIYETEGLSAADKYLESIEDYVNSRSGEYEAKIVLDGLKKAENPLDYLQNNCAIFAQGTADGLVSYINGLQNILAENNILSPEEYKSLYILEALMPMEDKISYGLVEPLESGEYLSYNEENLTDKNVDFSIDYCNDYGVSKDGYLLGQTVGSITLPLALSIVIPTGGAYFGATASALSTYGNSKHSVLVSGGTLDQARFSGANDAAVSAAVWILGGKFSKACIDLAGKNIFAAMANGSTSADAIAIVSYCYDLDSLARKKYETGDYETYEQAYNAAFEDLGGIEGFKNKIIVATVTGGFYGMGHHKYAQNVQSNTTVEKTITNDSTGEEAVVAMTRPKALKAEKSVRSANPVKVSASTKLNTISSINSYAKSFVKEEVKKPKIVESEKGIDEYEKEGVNND